MSECEEWRPIPGFPGYQASSEGRIRNRSGRILTGTLARKRHRQVNVRSDRGRETVGVHYLVAAAFFGLPPPGVIVAHKNGDKLDNRPSNLKVLPPQGNVRHAAALGLPWPNRVRGEKNPNAKLNAEKVRRMRQLRQQGMSLADLGKMFGVTTRAVHRVVTRKDWKHIP